MKFLHWVIFSIACWIVIAPVVSADIVHLFAPNSNLSSEDLLHLLKWDAFFLGLALFVLALVILTIETATRKTPGLRAMHWMQCAIGAYIAIAPFTLPHTQDTVFWSHAIAGGSIALFALLQIFLEPNLS